MLNLPISFRHATAEDSKALAELAERTFRATFAAQNDPSDLDLHCQTHFSEPIQRDEINNSQIITLLAYVEEQLAGYAQVHRASSQACVPFRDQVELHRIYIDQRFHGQGLAPALLEQVFAAAATEAAKSIWLGVWELNARAIKFYEKHGFKAYGSHTFLFGVDPQRDLILARSLA